jgi:hypothetical protein
VIGRSTFHAVRGSAGRTSSTWTLKKILASLLVVGALSSVTAGTTFALLTSQESNAGGFVSTGTLTLSDVVNGGSTCFSYGGSPSPGNVNNGCAALFSSANQNYPGTAAFAQVAIKNAGSIAASDLSVYMPSCTSIVTPGAPTPGGANPCATGGDQFYIEETDSSFTVATSTCRYPAAAGPCSFAADTLNQFSTYASTTATALDLGAGPVAGATRYFIVGMQLPSNASNSLQGQAAQFGLTWHITS